MGDRGHSTSELVTLLFRLASAAREQRKLSWVQKKNVSAMGQSRFFRVRYRTKNPKADRWTDERANKEIKQAREREVGSQGAASPVRKIDPATGKVIGVIPARS